MLYRIRSLDMLKLVNLQNTTQRTGIHDLLFCQVSPYPYTSSVQERVARIYQTAEILNILTRSLRFFLFKLLPTAQFFVI